MAQASLALADARFEKALEASFRDSLTGLANRSFVLARVKEELESNENTAFAFIDLDGFKHVNDTHGHLVGDKLLAAIAKRIKNSVREVDVAGRLGGDEFGVLFRQIDNMEMAKELAGRIVEAVAQPVAIDDLTIMPRLSIGLSIGKDIDVDALVSQADMAMYKAKRDPSNSVEASDARQ